MAPVEGEEIVGFWAGRRQGGTETKRAAMKMKREPVYCVFVSFDEIRTIKNVNTKVVVV
jgi:hypothetical protein